MRELLIINNEPTPEDRGRIARAGELGLTDPLYNIDALSVRNGHRAALYTAQDARLCAG